MQTLRIGRWCYLIAWLSWYFALNVAMPIALTYSVYPGIVFMLHGLLYSARAEACPLYRPPTRHPLLTNKE